MSHLRGGSRNPGALAGYIERVSSHPRADAARNREAILDAALVALGRDPQASLLDVAQEAGVGRATVYRHFATRNELVTALRTELLRRAQLVVDAVDAVGPANPLGALRAAIESLAPLGVTFRAIVESGAHADPGFLQARDQVLRPVYGGIARARDEGLLDPATDPQWASAALAALLVAAVRLSATQDMDAGEVAERVLATFLRAFGAPGVSPVAEVMTPGAAPSSGSGTE